jgi:putative transcriptional regulator
MIRCHLARIMGEHKMRIADVARETGLSRATITLLYKETAQKVDLEALDQICALFHCGIGELLEYSNPKDTGEPKNIASQQKGQ